MAKKRTLLSWSSGKDSAYTLDRLQHSTTHEVVGLVTLYSAHERVFMHAVSPTLVDLQARAAGLPVIRIDLPRDCSHDEYERLWVDALVAAKLNDVAAVAFGDLFLPEVRAGREMLARKAGIEPIFPIWLDGRSTQDLANDMIASGLSAIITCGDPRKLPRDFVGKRWEELVAAQPDGIDLCGEYGEFHTFTTFCAAFRERIPASVHSVVERDGFVFADLRV